MDLGTMVRELGTGMLITTEIFVLTLVFSLPLGMVLAFGVAASRSVGRSEKGARPSGLCDDIAFAGREARGDRPGRRRSPRAG